MNAGEFALGVFSVVLGTVVVAMFRFFSQCHDKGHVFWPSYLALHKAGRAAACCAACWNLGCYRTSEYTNRSCPGDVNCHHECPECLSPIEPDGLQHDPTCSQFPGPPPPPLSRNTLAPRVNPHPVFAYFTRCICQQVFYKDIKPVVEETMIVRWHHLLCNRFLPLDSYIPPPHVEEVIAICSGRKIRVSAHHPEERTP